MTLEFPNQVVAWECGCKVVVKASDEMRAGKQQGREHMIGDLARFFLEYFIITSVVLHWQAAFRDFNALINPARTRPQIASHGHSHDCS